MSNMDGTKNFMQCYKGVFLVSLVYIVYLSGNIHCLPNWKCSLQHHSHYHAAAGRLGLNTRLILINVKRITYRLFNSLHTGPRSAVGNVSCNRCESDSRSRGRKFDPGSVHETFVDIDHEIISRVILLPFAESFKKGCCQLQSKVCAQSTS